MINQNAQTISRKKQRTRKLDRVKGAKIFKRNKGRVKTNKKTREKQGEKKGPSEVGKGGLPKTAKTKRDRVGKNKERLAK